MQQTNKQKINQDNKDIFNFLQLMNRYVYEDSSSERRFFVFIFRLDEDSLSLFFVRTKILRLYFSFRRRFFVFIFRSQSSLFLCSFILASCLLIGQFGWLIRRELASMNKRRNNEDINIGGFFDRCQFLVDSRRVYNCLLTTPSSSSRGDIL